jgi:hypothetical protein
MKRTIGLAIAIAALTSIPAFAAPTPAQKTEFYAVCMAIAQDQTLCSCKADAAMTLIDEDFMAMVIAAMQGGSVPQAQYRAYNAYVAKSNQICKPNY